MPDYKLVIFDDCLGNFGPLTDFRAAFELRTGAITTLERIERVLGRPSVAFLVNPELEELVTSRWGNSKLINTLPESDDHFLLINGRWRGIALTSDDRTIDQVKLLEPDQILTDLEGVMLAGCLNRQTIEKMIADNQYDHFGNAIINKINHKLLINRPWDILEDLQTAMSADIVATSVPLCDAARANNKTITIFGSHPVRIAPDAELQPNVVINAEQGPVVVHSQALIGALSVLEGPCYIGRETTVACQTHIRLVTSIGPVCKVAGEISHSILQGYSNKAHHGYLGHALVGKWVNLGAATNVSNLKNTYSDVRMKLTANSEPEDTGQMYQGPVIGDFVRTAIATKILTGSCISTGCMIASGGFAPKFADRFGWYTDSGCDRYDVKKLIETIKKMMARRDCTMSQAEINRLRYLASQG